MNKVFLRHFLIGLICAFPLWAYITLIDILFFRFIFTIAIFWIGLIVSYGLYLYFTSYFKLIVTTVQYVVTSIVLTFIIGMVDVILSNILRPKQIINELLYSILLLTLSLIIVTAIKILSDRIFKSFGYLTMESKADRIIRKWQSKKHSS